MLFNSIEFIFLFLPVTLAGFYVLRRFAPPSTVYVWLAAASLFYYGYWNPAYLWLIAFSIVFNFAVGGWLGKKHGKQEGAGRPLLWGGVAVNLLLLGYYKYTGFFLGTVANVLGKDWAIPAIILPLGISFFTFQQIAYLVDAYQGKTKEYNFAHYCLFVTFFPQLIAGPIVHHREMLSQFAEKSLVRLRTIDFAQGVSFFSAGLFKKVVLADALAAYVSPNFSLMAEGSAFGFSASWMLILAYTFQVYFDFSGYSDMAIGLGKLFGINLPENFNSPYKAGSMVEFWHRWHMTLSRFLRDYLYIPLGGNRKGAGHRYVNLMLTMLIGGLWHGAGWLFVIWGGLHGLYLCTVHGWHAMMRRFNQPAFAATWPWRFFCHVLTFLAVVLAWVFFRAETPASAWLLLKGMAGANVGMVPFAAGNLADWLLFSAAVAWLLPNTADFVFGRTKLPGRMRWLQPVVSWSPTMAWAVFYSVLMLASIGHLNRVSEFIYYQF